MASGTASLGGSVRIRWAAPGEFDRARALRLLGPAERARADATGHDGLRDRFLVGRMLLRDLAAATAGLPSEAIAVTAACERCGAEHGRPRLVWPEAAGPPPLASLASCAELVIAAIAPAGVSVGVDVEPSRAAPRETDADRRRAITELLGGAPRSAIRRWVRAEAVLKADGRGLRVEPGAVTFERGLARVADRSTRYRVIDRRIDGCLVSVAVADPPVE